jgi:catechol-2,3-dioxygenase
LSHVVLRAVDHKKAIAWYAEVLRGKVVYENEFIAFMTYDEEHHRIGVAKIPGQGAGIDPQKSALSHIAFAFSNVRDVIDQYSYMKSIGYQPRNAVNHGPTISFYYTDPDGNGVEFLVDRFPDPEEASAWMYTDVYKKNPYGLPIDPESLVEKMDAGATDEELLFFDEDAAMAFDYEGFTRKLGR